MQLDFLNNAPPVRERFPDAQVEYVEDFLPAATADRMFARLRDSIDWRQDSLTMFGKRHLIPRLQQWFADAGLVYTWSGIRMEPTVWTPELEELRSMLHEHTGARFNTALANLYRDGDDTVGWHADDEPELGEEPVIASLSFGAPRDFVLRHNTRKDVDKATFTLGHGSLLVMSGRTQYCWQHCLPRRKRCRLPRINLTFRLVRPSRAGEDGSYTRVR